ncbi:histidine kinase [uncultured Polaribacter sp.]|uniref:sensor histidine kinase n=1 Tax=uncultured Polaribacter sp. TaxID=174711 RepID=UPI00262FF0C6|nr:histidine kinase [uncultured Polaribacter sp.]
MRKNTIFILFLFLFAFFSSAQEPLAIHLTEKDGLPDVTIYDMLEDNQGFIWLAADKGLYRYDGREYKLFTNPLKRGRSLFSLKLDEQGRLWCNNLAGQFFYINNDRLELYKDFEDVKTLVDYYFFDKHLVVYNKDKILFVALDSKKIEKTLAGVIQLNNNSFQKKLDHFYFTRNDTVYKLNSLKSKLKAIGLLNTTKNFKRATRQLFAYQENTYILEQNESELLLKLKNLNSNRYLEIPKKINGKVIHKVIVKEHTIYLLSNKGIYFCKIKDNSLQVLQHYFKENYATDYLLDKNKNLWFSTLKNGIYVISNLAFQIYDKDQFKDITFLLKKNENTLFLAKNNGRVLEYNISNKSINYLNFTSLTAVKSLYYNNISNELFIINNNITTVYNLTNNTSKKFNLGAAKSIDYIKDDMYLVSSSGSFLAFDFSTNTKHEFISKRSYNAVYVDQTKQHFVTLIDGFAEYYPKDEKFRTPLYNSKKVYGSLLEKTADGTVWISTHTNGILAYKNNCFTDSLIVKNGLASTIINDLQAADKTLWISTDKGLQTYDYKEKKIKTITKVDGLATYTINNIAVLDSLVFLNTNTNIISFNKNKVFKTKEKPKIYFNSLEVNRAPVALKEELQLKQDKSDFKIYFNSNGFQSKENIIYEYWLDGFSKNYTRIAAGINFINFNTLPTGNFTLKVRAKNKYETQYSDAIALKIQVTNPFYKSIWFLLLCGLILLIFIYLYFDKKNKRLQKEQKIALEKAEISKELVFSQLENLRSQMNPHFIFNALNSIQDFIILNEKKLARQYLVKFSKLIRIYLEHSQKNEITLEEELKALQLYLDLEKDRFNDGLFFEINVDKALNTSLVYLPSLFLQPYVENSLKHGLLHKKEDKKIQIEFLKKQENLVCIITDNGIGRVASAEINKKRNNKPKSFATSANQKRIDLLNLANNTNSTLKIEDLYNDNLAIGTKVIINIPVKK